MSELRKDSLRFGQMPDGAGALSPAFVKQAKDHFGATDMMAIDIELRVVPDLRNERFNRSRPNQ